MQIDLEEMIRTNLLLTDSNTSAMRCRYTYGVGELMSSLCRRKIQCKESVKRLINLSTLCLHIYIFNWHHKQNEDY